MSLRDYNFFGPIVPQACLDRAELIVGDLLSQKNENFRRLSPKRQAAKLGSNHNYQVELGYEEQVELDSLRMTTVRYFFRKLAKEFGLFDEATASYLDLAIVDAMTYRSNVQFRGKGQKTQVPRFAVEGGKRNCVFMKWESAVSMYKGKPSEAEIGQYRTGIRLEREASVEITQSNGLPVNMNAKEADAQDKENAKNMAELIKLREENTRLSGRTMTSHTPLSQAGESQDVQAEAPPTIQ